jgi:tetratricopeptide (TPR) repeat protein
VIVDTAIEETVREAETARIPQSAVDFLNRGLIFAQRGDFDTALEDFTEAINRDPNMTLAYLQRGKTLFARQADITDISEGFELTWVVKSRNKTSDDESALADFTQAIKNNPNLYTAYSYRGRLYGEIKEYDKAITDLTQAIRINPNYARAYSSRGNIYSDKGEYDRAIADYTQAIKLDPNGIGAHTDRGDAYQTKGDMAKANADFAKAKSLGR